MFSEKHVIHIKKWMIFCLLFCQFIFCTACAEMTAEIPLEMPAVQETVPTDAVQEAGSQIHIGPVLMVTEYSVIEGETVPGSSFVLQMNIANLSETASAHNVLTTLSIENLSVSLQEKETNQRYFREILPGETVTVQYPLEVYSYCIEENMILSMTMTCYDAMAVHYDFQTMMTPNIEVVRTLRVGSLTVPQFVHRNSSMIISATLINAEPVTLNHVKMHVVTQYGEETTEVGQLLTGESKTINGIYRFPNQQTEAVQVYFTYESLYGHQYTTDHRSFEVVVYDPTEQSDFTDKGTFDVREIVERLVQNTVVPGTERLIPVPVAALIAVGCVGYCVILHCVLRKKRK